MDLQIAYAFDNRVPSPQADTEQLVSTVAALSRRGLEVTLVIPRLGEEVGAGEEAAAGEGAGTGEKARAGNDAGAEEIRRFYGVEGSFRVARYPCPRWPRALQKGVAPLRAVRTDAARVADLIHTRNLPVALAGIAAGRRVVLETYRPWPDQLPVLRPVIRRLMGHPSFVGAILHSRLAKESYARLGVDEGR
ncbi:MAG TPA: hypothetical protein VLL48_08520, partial [Longimicrobiales bacterium]|nr:hypothetical protein [Longimicrobiales bacterium]